MSCISLCIYIIAIVGVIMVVEVELYSNSQLCPNNLGYAVHGMTHWCVPSSVQVTVYLVYVHAHNLIIRMYVYNAHISILII